MFSNQIKLTGFILSLITVIHSTFTCFISIVIIFIIIYELCYKNLKREERTTLFLCVNIYLFLLIYMMILSLMNIQTILGDLYERDFNSTLCIFIGYLSPVILCVLYHSFVNQAFFRLCRIVYFRYRWLQLHWWYIIIPLLQLILAFALLSPLLVWHDIIYLLDEHYCYAAFMNFRGILWTAFISYVIPASIVFIIYIRITIFIRQQPHNQTQAIQRRQARDLLVIRRILITVGLLITLGFPSVVLVIMGAITGEEYVLSFRITWISLSISMTGLSIAMVLFIPQLKSIVWKKFQRNRITPGTINLEISIQVRPDIRNR
ncbi:unnamed protein product [Adineta steineri]|uniref:G-protein coupled receptors family 1 profile domain-containing protein n=1 Tax=Adineta steineri TaxID=433720 RepID=A0A814SYF9_9BILA|nr:unnamed protein product [Adineta steineri]CAF0848040.1 unnamed protein product [Adineta steineri]CAF1154188.1 unnamed protein product [Adineta steineri]